MKPNEFDIKHYIKWEMQNFINWMFDFNEYLQERARRFYGFIEKDKTLKYGVVMSLLFYLMFIVLETFGNIGILFLIIGAVSLWIISAIRGRMKLYAQADKVNKK